MLGYMLEALSGGSTIYTDELVKVPAGAVRLGMTQQTAASAVYRFSRSSSFLAGFLAAPPGSEARTPLNRGAINLILRLYR